MGPGETVRRREVLDATAFAHKLRLDEQMESALRVYDARGRYARPLDWKMDESMLLPWPSERRRSGVVDGPLLAGAISSRPEDMPKAPVEHEAGIFHLSHVRRVV